ncbi:MAG: hypothetical protein GEU81_07205 [Nitriliruptorales bacterium]|nr:hypothetical protein [Nitriliruptorales bacterium]
MVEERHIVAEENEYGRIVLMDSITHANEEFGPGAVLIGGSWMGVVPVSFATRYHPKAVLCNDAGVGVNGAGINALYYLDGLGIPGAAVASDSAMIANGRSHWDTGAISFVNHWARACGCEPGMSVREAARALLRWTPQMKEDAPSRESREVVYSDEEGEIVVADSIKYINADDEDRVICVGSHGGETTCGYAVDVSPRGVVTSDGGGGRDNAGTRGLKILAKGGIPAVAVSVHSAPIGDGLSIYEDGVVSVVNEPAAALGLRAGMRARVAAMEMLRRPK